jgi:hypothetical protein
MGTPFRRRLRRELLWLRAAWLCRRAPGHPVAHLIAARRWAALDRLVTDLEGESHA